MFEYFPGNYVWNLSVLITLQNGGTIGEVDEACRPIREAAAGGVDAGTEQFFAAWSAVADRLVTLAQEDEERGWTLSAGENGPAPCIVQWNGFDSFKEHMLGSLFPTSWPAVASRR
jgi:hypothetical protein